MKDRHIALSVVVTMYCVAGALLACGRADDGALTSLSGRQILQASPVADKKFCQFPRNELANFSINTLTPLPNGFGDRIVNLHSKPGARYKIYLDFDGQDLGNSEYRRLGWQNVEPLYDVQNPVHQMAIYSVWQLVSERFVMFNVDVTTEEPTGSELGINDPEDDDAGIYRKTAVAAIIGSAQFLNGGAGFEMYDAFRSVGYWPAILQVSLLYSPEDIALIIAHEVGHAFGLNHDGVNRNDYHSGTPTWGPIMGAPYSSRFVQWSDGAYPDATNHENDLATLQAMLNREGDDFSNGIDSAAMLQSSAANCPGATLYCKVIKPVTGVIENSADADVFKLAASGRIKFFYLAFGRQRRATTFIRCRIACSELKDS